MLQYSSVCAFWDAECAKLTHTHAHTHAHTQASSTAPPPGFTRPKATPTSPPGLSPPSTTPSLRGQGSSSTAMSSGKKKRFVPLMSREGQSKVAMHLPGRHVCQCLAQKHELVNNCVECGRIVCSQVNTIWKCSPHTHTLHAHSDMYIYTYIESYMVLTHMRAHLDTYIVQANAHTLTHTRTL